MSPRDDMKLLLWKTVPIFHYFQTLVSWDHSVNEDKWCNRFGIKHLDAFLPLHVHTGNINCAGGDVENFSATFLSIFILFVSTTCSISESSISVNIEGKFFDESNISFQIEIQSEEVMICCSILMSQTYFTIYDIWFTNYLAWIIYM